jgi:RNA polymerase sigma-70 factor, ECF subfamily
MSHVSSLKQIFGRNAPFRSNDAFGRLYAQTYLNVFRYIYGLHGGPVADVEDFTAETFLRAWKARHRFAGPEHTAIRWLLTIARNVVIDTKRKPTARGYDEALDSEKIVATEPSIDEHLIQDEQTRVLHTLLRTLPAEQREMLVLRYILGWPVNHIAELLGQKPNTVTVTIRRTLLQLRHAWPQPKMEDYDAR